MAKATSTPSQRRLKGQDSREIILAVALELFTQRGYDGTLIDDNGSGKLITCTG